MKTESREKVESGEREQRERKERKERGRREGGGRRGDLHQSYISLWTLKLNQVAYSRMTQYKECQRTRLLRLISDDN